MFKQKFVAGALALALSLPLAASAQEISDAQFEKAMEKYLNKEENIEKFSNQLQNYFRKKQTEQAKLEQENEAKEMEKQFSNPVKVEIGKAPIKGNPNAKITIVEFSDFECPYCQRGAQTMDEVLKNYPNDVKIAFKHLPLPFHQKAKPAAKAAMAAGVQGKFWEMHDKLFANQEELNEAGFAKFAQELGLNVEKFKQDMKNPEFDKIIEEDSAEARKLGIQGTPGFLVNGVEVKGARPFEYFQTIIEKWKKQLG